MENIEHIPLNSIIPNPINPRKVFTGEDFNELTISVKKKGVISPIALRKKDKGYEIIYGERRWRASVKAGLDKIPAIVMEATDDEVFDLMTIENLHRENLNGYEEAESFDKYVKKQKNSKEAAVELSERTGINLQYIHRRLAIMKLPKKVIKSWKDGVLKFGHLEQFLRINDPKELNDVYENVLSCTSHGYSIVTVNDLKEIINRIAINLSKARFNLSKCETCNNNSSIQKSLFGILADAGKAVYCLDQKCFEKKQAEWFTANWNKTGLRKTYKTNGFAFNGNFKSNYHTLWDNPQEKECKDCERFRTLMNIDGTSFISQICHDPTNEYEKCAKKANKASNESLESNGIKPAKGAWHGEYFREAFLKIRILERFTEIVDDELKNARIVLFSIIRAGKTFHEKASSSWIKWFATETNSLPKDIDSESMEWWTMPDILIWNIISEMKLDQIKELTAQAAIRISINKDTTSDARKAIADHIGIDLKKEWKITEEYLKKKTKVVILEIGEKYKIFEDKDVKKRIKFLVGKDIADPKKMKKIDLINVFMESGVDLTGIVPDEILS